MGLKEYLESRFQAFSARLDAYVNQHREMHEKLAEQVVFASAAIDRRLEAMNELRQQLNAERGSFVTRDMLDQRALAFASRIDDLSRRVDQRIDEQGKRMSEMERAKANLDGRVTMTGVMLLGASVVVNLLISFLAQALRTH